MRNFIFRNQAVLYQYQNNEYRILYLDLQKSLPNLFVGSLQTNNHNTFY